MKNSIKILFTIFLLVSFLMNPVDSQISLHIDSNTDIGIEEADITITGDLYLDGDVQSLDSRIIFTGIEEQYIYQPSAKTLEYLRIDKNAGRLHISDSLWLSDSLSLLQGKLVTADTAVLHMLPLAGVSGGDTSSFVDGPMASVYPVSAQPDSFIFPTGNTLDYRPVTVYFTAVNNDSLIVTVKQFNGAPAKLGGNLSGIDKISSKHYWHIGASGPGEFDEANVTLSYDTLYTDDVVELGSELRMALLDTMGPRVWYNIGGSGSEDYAGTIRSDEQNDLLSGYFTFGDAAGGGDISLPVLLSLFDLSEKHGEVILNWKSASEINNQYWLIQRKDDSRADSLEAESAGKADPPTGGAEEREYTTIARLEGQGTKSSETLYSFMDNGVETGKQYSYRLADVSSSGRKHYHPAEKILIGLPTHFELHQNFPNPFNPVTNIQYELPAELNVTIDVFNILGQKVAGLVSKKQQAGYYKLVWDGQNASDHKLPSGLYILTIHAQGKIDGEMRNYSKMQKMVLVK